jgi:hypothetical protein
MHLSPKPFNVPGVLPRPKLLWLFLVIASILTIFSQRWAGNKARPRETATVRTAPRHTITKMNMNAFRPMLTISSRFGIYNGPYVQSRPVIIRTDYMGEINYGPLRLILDKNNITASDFELVKDEKRELDRDLYVVALFPGMVFHGRN